MDLRQWFDCGGPGDEKAGHAPGRRLAHAVLRLALAMLEPWGW